MVHYSSEFYSDDDLKDWPPISSFAAFMPSVFSLDLNVYLEGGLIWPLWYHNCQAVVACISVLGKRIEVKRRIYWELCTFFIDFFVILTYNNSFNWNSNSHLLLCFICIFFPLFLSGICVIDRKFFFNFYSIGMKNVFCLILIWKI